MLVSNAARAAATLSAVAVAGMLTFTGVGFAKDVDCGDFTYREDAQAVLDRDRSDPNRLDDEGDGKACESLPSRGGESSETDEAEPAGRAESDDGDGDGDGDSDSGKDRDYAGFASQKEAQDALDAAPSDPERLDLDDDGVACEEHFGDDDQQVQVRPKGAVDTGGWPSDG